MPCGIPAISREPVVLLSVAVEIYFAQDPVVAGAGLVDGHQGVMVFVAVIGRCLAALSKRMMHVVVLCRHFLYLS